MTSRAYGGMNSLTSERSGVDAALHLVATAVEVAGVAIIVIGAVAATALFLHRGLTSRG